MVVINDVSNVEALFVRFLLYIVHLQASDYRGVELLQMVRESCTHRAHGDVVARFRSSISNMQLYAGLIFVQHLTLLMHSWYHLRCEPAHLGVLAMVSLVPPRQALTDLS